MYKNLTSHPSSTFIRFKSSVKKFKQNTMSYDGNFLPDILAFSLLPLTHTKKVN